HPVLRARAPRHRDRDVLPPVRLPDVRRHLHVDARGRPGRHPRTGPSPFSRPRDPGTAVSDSGNDREIASHGPAPILPPVELPAFSGPLDLLLHLIRKNEVSITDIPIALITEQYTAHLDLMRELDLDVAAEYVYLAAILIHIKSRSLLPRDPSA